MTETMRGLQVVTHTDIDAWRVRTWETKEPGTIAWIDTFADGDVVYDVGANVGIYTLLAAQKVGPTGHVYAIEPHPANVAALMANVAANDFQDRVTVVSVALGAQRQDLIALACPSLVTGSSGAQAGGETVDEYGRPFVPRASVVMPMTTLDVLLVAGEWRRPTHIKVDVDGHEVDVLTGAYWTLKVESPETIQVETRAATEAQIAAILDPLRFTQRDRHYTSLGAKALARGADPVDIPSNWLCRRAA